ncbi:hypothetical protein [Chryseobacterium binzhouense]|jgi:hypothetical protein|uniref:hypothetical protein n=1 Tax=Chryseobacterium binzhouense TaxID=2593646 RepID=UPI00289FA295|nr:hypothetical protein [Chryseobacterium binzhouense]
MERSLFAAILLGFLFTSCSKDRPIAENNNEVLPSRYDTTAIDSFSDGAVSVDVARQIRMSSQKYQDSLKEVLKMQQEEKRIKEELDKEKKKAEEENKLKEKPLKDPNQ